MISGATLDERDQAYTYDGLDRVIDTDQGTANDTTGAITTKKFEQQWKLDQLGNWEEFDQDDNGNGTWDLEQSRTHNDANEVTAVDLQSMGAGANWADPAFDAAGNMTTLPQPGSLASSYTAKYDAWNRLVSLDSGTTASYAYDGLNRRIQRTEGSTTRHFYYNANWQALEERATEAGDAIKQFVWGAQYVDELVLRDRDADSNSVNGLEERLYALSDAQYNVTALVNTSGSVQERFSYAPYGTSTVLNADLTVKGGGTGYAWEHRYTSRRLDPGSGLQLNRNRYYHQQLGRWCSRDPIGFYGGDMNLFNYVRSRPLGAVDPIGFVYSTCYLKNSKRRRLCVGGGHYPGVGANRLNCVFRCKCHGDSGEIEESVEIEPWGSRRQYDDQVCRLHLSTVLARGDCPEDDELEPDPVPDPAPYPVPVTIPFPTPAPEDVETCGWVVVAGVVIYWCISEGSRIFPPRNFIPVP